MGSNERYKPSKIKIYTYPDKQLTREFDNLDSNRKAGVSTPLNTVELPTAFNRLRPNLLTGLD